MMQKQRNQNCNKTWINIKSGTKICIGIQVNVVLVTKFQFNPVFLLKHLPFYTRTPIMEFSSRKS